ncbi:MAG: sigma-54-dependent Fis family transcriptional regulator [Planctomycetes bacterium]|uniref:sigma-54-dependent transcriptional regulator n=1 Tax=Candidatus Wunengus sp. YC65 TaxID=3367701 RepID=UPI001D321264|nr:sigma-54-dependent Fis family transcriptional regulator [Planctomycetota bacterium]
MATDSNISVLIIDDEVDMCDMLSHVLGREGFTIYTAHDGNTGLEVFNKESPSVVILDLRMPGMNGMDVLKQIKHTNSETPVIIITAYGEIQSAVEAIKHGAYNYFNKPFDNEEVVVTVEKAIEERAMRQEIRMLKTQLSFVMPLYEQMGNSAEIVKVNESVKCVAPTNFTVVIYGETGSGKELIAQSIHNRSPRCDKPFVVVDCGSIPETLIESELFGFEKGAFTGADQKKVGQFEIASGGTLFLDEIGNLPKSMQGKLLRVLQERRIRRLGSNKEIDVDVRVVVAGNERLEYLIESGHFRMDLYQRLNEFCIEIPPLRRRKDDIVFLCKRFLDITNKELNKNVRGITKETLEMLLTYNWPGNVRELKNVIRRAVLLASEVIEPKHLLIKIQEQKQQASPATGQIASTANRDADHTVSLDLDINNGKDFSLRNAVARCVEHAEKKLITEALKRTGGNKSQAARILKIDYKTMHYKVKNYGIKIQTTTEITEKSPTEDS